MILCFIEGLISASMITSLSLQMFRLLVLPDFPLLRWVFQPRFTTYDLDQSVCNWLAFGGLYGRFFRCNLHIFHATSFKEGNDFDVAFNADFELNFKTTA